MEIHIEKINAAATYPIRHTTLRKGKPLSTCFFDGDVDPQTIHLGAFVGDQLVGVVSIYDNPAPQFPEKIQKQLRGMAVLEAFQGNGIGKLLLTAAEKEIEKREKVRIWFNARTAAVPFYEKALYQCVGDAFTIPEVGEHYLMTKPS
ncbi:GNAT family N-acetyltransferase [Flavobacterium sp.]|uniref:GNAT family N-acetyltransferase n=1 Tax=Flavobacterium sp. TaxID=239 RepID=UPI002634A811|nr:GNAT family N-acetyltransferase [Flavobacterium sp.]